MKKIALSIILATFTVALFAQANNDRRGYQGVVTANAKETVKPEGKQQADVNTPIEFTGRAITVEGETYEIIKKTFDGKNQTVFTCTKRRGTYDITYKVGESITVVDTSNKDIITVYRSLKEK